MSEMDLDAAWAAAEVALPDGAYITAIQRYNHPPIWEVHSWHPGRGEMAYGKGETPAEALRALAARLDHETAMDMRALGPEDVGAK